MSRALDRECAAAVLQVSREIKAASAEAPRDQVPAALDRVNARSLTGLSPAERQQPAALLRRVATNLQD